MKIKPRDKISQDSRISELRNDVRTAYKEYSVLNTNDSQEKLSKAKQLLQEEYDTIEDAILNSNIKRIEYSNEQSRHSNSCKLINKVTERRNPKRGKSKAISKEDRVRKWHEYC